MANYLIDFVDDASIEDISSYLASNQCNMLKKYNGMNKVFLISATVAPPLTDKISSVIPDENPHIFKLLSTVDVVQVVPGGEAHIDVNNQKDWWKGYSLNDLDFSTALVDVPIHGEGVTIYIVDSGIDISHPEFAGKDISMLYSVTGEFSDSTGHGTALSSVIVGDTCSLTNSKLKVVKLFDKTHETLQSEFLSALDAIIQDAAVSPNTPAVVNLSWSIPKNIYIEQKIQFLINANIAVIVSAGNSGVPIEDVTPASMTMVLNIGSYGVNFLPSNFSDYSDPLIVGLTQNSVNHGMLGSWAPGEQIWAAKAGGGYGFISGTSVSAAIYSASVAYSQSLVLSDTGLMSGYYDASGRLDCSQLTVYDRRGLLDLSDPKYATSQNKICTYLKFVQKRSINIVMPTKLVVTMGSIDSQMLFVPPLTKSYELLTPLPTGAFIEGNYLTYRPVAEPVDPSGVDVSEIHYRVTNITGEVIETYVTLVVLSSTFDVNLLPPNDPLIDITQLVLCLGTVPANCYLNCIPSGNICDTNHTTGKTCTCYA